MYKNIYIYIYIINGDFAMTDNGLWFPNRSNAEVADIEDFAL